MEGILRTALVAMFVTLVLLCGCTSFAVNLELPDMASADVVFSAQAVRSITKTQDCEDAEILQGVRRMKVEGGAVAFALPFVPAEMVISVTASGVEGMVRIESAETAHGETSYNSKAMNAPAKDWRVELTPRNSSGLDIRIITGK
jgi:hypothetical protein